MTLPRVHWSSNCLAEQYGLIARFEDARAAAALSRSIALELGQPFDAATTSHVSAPNERLAGNGMVAERELRADIRTLEGAGEQWMGSTTAGFLAHMLCDRDAFDEATKLTEEAEAISADDDNLSQVLWRSARARALARRDPVSAVKLARDAVARAAATEILIDHGNALLSLAEVHEVAGRLQDAVDAIALFQAKGATAYVNRAEAHLQQLQVGHNA